MRAHELVTEAFVSVSVCHTIWAFLSVNPIRDRSLFLIGGGVTIFGTCRQIFKSNVFQTIFFITFYNENNFFTTIFKKMLQAFYRSYLKNKNTSCACIHMKSLI